MSGSHHTWQTVPSIAFETLGCKLNQYETDSIATTLHERGYRIVPFTEHADAYVVNSCTVTNKADRKSRNTVYRARRLGGENAVVVLTGCFTDNRNNWKEGAPQQIADPLIGASYIVDNAHKNTIPDLLEAHFRGELPNAEALEPNIFGFSTPQRIFHTRTNVKIQDGCDNFCTFCIIPFVRGRATSRSPQAIITEARDAINHGSKELVLTGVNMSRYHGDNGVDFVTLVERILNLPGDFRLRISSLEPDRLDDRFVRLFGHPKMSPHLHLCVQSGSDRILLAMRRMYTSGQFRAVVESLRALNPLLNITTDMIVGFPGETEEDTMASVSLIQELNIGHVHTFPFSVRNGTRAERMPDKIPHHTIAERSRLIRDHAEDEKRRYRVSLIGTRQRVLIERVEQHGNVYIGQGLGEYYVPVQLESDSPIETNSFYDVTVEAIAEGADPHLIGRGQVPVPAAIS